MENKKKVLIVDDNANFNQLLQCALEDDFQVFSAIDGEDGLEKALKLRPDIILMDVMMPNVSGIELARMLNAEEETRHIPAIVLTGSNLDKGTPALFKQERNVKLFISKHSSILEIVTAVKNLTGT